MAKAKNDGTARLRDKIADIAGSHGRFYSNYSGRGMYGKECVGIVTSDEDAVIKAATRRGITGAVVDSLGHDAIVYWPHIAAEA